MNHIKVIIFLGPPASGKGTQAHIIAEKIGAQYFSVSKLIQEKFKNFSNDKDVIIAKTHHDKGELVPPQILVKWTVSEIDKLLQKGKKIVFDGAFRTEYETRYTFPILEKFLNLEEIKVFFLSISEDTAIKRSSTRRICEICLRPVPFNKKTKALTQCKHCGGRLISRIDEHAIHKRLEIYKKETLPVLDFFRQKGILIEIDGEPAIEAITKDIMKKIEKKI